MSNRTQSLQAATRRTTHTRDVSSRSTRHSELGSRTWIDAGARSLYLRLLSLSHHSSSLSPSFPPVLSLSNTPLSAVYIFYPGGAGPGTFLTGRDGTAAPPRTLTGPRRVTSISQTERADRDWPPLRTIEPCGPHGPLGPCGPRRPSGPSARQSTKVPHMGRHPSKLHETTHSSLAAIGLDFKSYADTVEARAAPTDCHAHRARVSTFTSSQ